jgi:2-methylcitrate synthase
MACLGSMLLYWYHFSHNGKRIDVETDDDSIGGHFLHLLHGEKPRIRGCGDAHLADPVRRARVQRLDLHLPRHRRHRQRHVQRDLRRHRRAARPKHGGANEVAFEIQKRYDNPDEAEADIKARVERKEVVIGFGHPVYTVSDPRNKVIKEVARELSEEAVEQRCSTSPSAWNR